MLHRIQTRHYGLTKHARSVITGAASSSSAPSTPSSSSPFPLPLPPGTPLPTEHLPPNDAKAISKMTTEWGKVEALQEEKVRLAERMERIVNRARERGRAEWVRVGGKDVDEIEKENAKMFGAGGVGTGMMASLGEMGNGEVILGPEGLGRIDRPQKSKLLNVHLPQVRCSLLGREASIRTPSSAIVRGLAYCPSSSGVFDATPSCTFSSQFEHTYRSSTSPPHALSLWGIEAHRRRRIRQRSETTPAHCFVLGRV